MGFQIMLCAFPATQSPGTLTLTGEKGMSPFSKARKHQALYEP